MLGQEREWIEVAAGMEAIDMLALLDAILYRLGEGMTISDFEWFDPVDGFLFLGTAEYM